jgi:TolB-like protein/Tfp pilus assembly protein PilF
LSELLHRRVPQIVGVYLAAGWGILEFTDWAVGRFGASSRWIVGVLIVWLGLLPAVIVVAWKFGRPGGGRIRTRPVPGKSIAVLPFSNLSADAGDEYLSDGISEEIINALTKIGGLRVVSRTSAFVYKGRSEDVRDIGEQLGVATVLEGSLQRAGERLRITAQLVDVSDGYHLWSDRFDREIEDVFSIQDQIAENIVRALRVILKDEERRAISRIPTANVQAYEFYLRGRQYFHEWRRKSLQYAREMFKRAIEADAGYALAWVGVAEASSFLNMYYPAIEPDVTEADEASQKALELDPDLPEAHAARGLVLFLKKDLEEAERELQTAIRLDPKLFEAYYFFARTCFQQGRIEEAAEFFGEAYRLRDDYQAAFFNAQSYEALGREDEAQAAYRRALRSAETHMELNPDDPRAATMRAVSHCRLGEREEGLRWAEQAIVIDPHDAGVKYNVACLYAVAGEPDRAMDCLEEAFQAGFGAIEWIQNDPDLESLRGHPRFEALISRSD